MERLIVNLMFFRDSKAVKETQVENNVLLDVDEFRLDFIVYFIFYLRKFEFLILMIFFTNIL